MATKDDTESFTVAVVPLTPGKFDIVSYTIEPTPPIVSGAKVLIRATVKNIGGIAATLTVTFIDADTSVVISSEKVGYTLPGASKSSDMYKDMPSKDWNIRIEAWRS